MNSQSFQQVARNSDSFAHIISNTNIYEDSLGLEEPENRSTQHQTANDGHTRSGRRTSRRHYAHTASSDEDYEYFDDHDEGDLSKLSPNSQRQARRRLTNRECARRNRQRKSDLMNELSRKVDELKAENHQLMQQLTAVTTIWRDISIENCKLEAELLFRKQLGEGYYQQNDRYTKVMVGDDDNTNLV